MGPAIEDEGKEESGDAPDEGAGHRSVETKAADRGAENEAEKEEKTDAAEIARPLDIVMRRFVAH